MRRLIGIGWTIVLTACAADEPLDTDLAAVKGAPAEETAAPDFVQVDWAAFDDCRDQLRELRRVHDRGEIADPRDLPFAVVVGPLVDRARLSPPSIPVADDLAIPINPADARTAPCLIQVDRPQIVAADWEELGQEAVASEYQSGTRRDENPDYELLKLRAKEIERRQDDADLEVWQGGGDPLAELVGLLVGSIATGFGEARGEHERGEIMTELAKTPSKINNPVYQTYHFERRVIDAVKQADVPVLLRDRRRGVTVRTVIRQTERRRFHVPIGLHARDRHYLQHRARSITRPGLETWMRSAPELRISEIVDGLLTARHGTPDPPGRRSFAGPPDTRLEATFRGADLPGPGLGFDDGSREPSTDERPGSPWRADGEQPPGPFRDHGYDRRAAGPWRRRRGGHLPAIRHQAPAGAAPRRDRCGRPLHPR